MSEQAKTNVQKLADVLGFNPTKESPTPSVFTEALAEITKERAERMRGRVKTELAKALELAVKLEKLDNEHKQQMNKWNKELGKVISCLMAFSKGAPEPKEEPAEEVKAD